MGKRIKRDEGYIYQLLPVLLSLGMVAVLVVLSADFFRVIRQRDLIDQIGREYLLMMETEGCLSATEQAALTVSLEEAGLCNVSLDGTTTVEAGYGSQIALCISGTLPQTVLGQRGLSWELPVSLRLKSTAKQ
ncbi:MAG: hypothetical protein LUC95_04190 [Lachnospiraceae bacterium]|nr:hypothetical protein [Lachnospiraceae bacterium]